jgi:hypothetical protein
MNKVPFVVFCSFLSLTALAQRNDSLSKKKGSIEAGLQYISNQTYAGRADSLTLPVLIPSLKFMTHSGLYIKANGYLNLSKTNSGFDGVSIEPGYQFTKKAWNGSIAFIKNFISDSSNLIIAPVKSSIEFYLANENKFIIPSIGAEYVFTSEGNDFILYAGLSKLFLLTHADKEPSVILNPAVTVTAGSQTFYYSFLQTYTTHGNGKGKGRGRGNSLPPTTGQSVKTQSQQFSLLGWAFELPLTVAKGKFAFNLTPAVESPLNLVNKGGTGTQAAKTYVYVTAGLTLTL